MSTPNIVLNVNGIEVIYNHVILVLKGVSLQVPERGIVAIGSGGAYAQAAAMALQAHSTLSPPQIVEQALTIAGQLCIYTNLHHTIEVLE